MPLINFLKSKFWILILPGIGLNACYSTDQYSLDRAIPRLQTPTKQIASLRTTWFNGRHTETVFYDHQGRIVEKFNFGRSSWKELHYYTGDQQTKSIYHSHSDSSEPGHVSVDTVNRTFDDKGRLVLESHVQATIPKSERGPFYSSYERHLNYTTAGDTIIKLERKGEKYVPPLADIDKWERDETNLLKSHYRLYVIGLPDATPPDTIEHYLRRFAYDTNGRLEQVWYERMYVGKNYMVPGPDTVWYRYNAHNRLIEEEHLYTTDMRNKREVDTTKLSSEDREWVTSARKRFITNVYGESDRRNIIKYQYEKFDASKHHELMIPISD